MTDGGGHVLVADSNLTVGAGWRCERCRLWSRTPEIAAGSACVTVEDEKRGVRRWPKVERGGEQGLTLAELNARNVAAARAKKAASKGERCSCVKPDITGYGVCRVCKLKSRNG